MSNRKGKTNGVMLASLAGLLAVAALGAWLLMQDGGDTARTKPVKPTVEVSR